MDNKRVLILGAGRGQLGLITAAKKLGYRTIVASIDGDYPGFEIGDEKCIVNIKDSGAVADKALELDIDGVVTAGMDMALPALGCVCESCGLPGPNERIAMISSNKLMMKDAFIMGGVTTARYIKASDEQDAKRALTELNMPLIIKPVDMGGSRGINIVFDEADIINAFNRTMQVTGMDYCIIEEYIDGYEVSATSLVADGRVEFVLPMGDVRYGENDEVPVGHYVPLDCEAAILDEIDKEVRLAIKAIGLDNCAVNADLMIYNGKAYVLELTGRLGANAIPEITSTYYGRDIHELIVEIAVGNYEVAHDAGFDNSRSDVCYGQMIISEKSGILNKATLGDAEVDEWFFLKEGAKVNKFRNPGDCIGQVVLVGASKEDCARRIGELFENLEVIDC